MREHLFPKPRDDALGSRGQEIDLHEIHCALKREEGQQRDRDPIEQSAVVTLEGGVEQVPNDLWKRESDACRD